MLFRLDGLVERPAGSGDSMWSTDRISPGVRSESSNGTEGRRQNRGEIAGERPLLEVVARRLQQSVRSADLVARLGGDEFAVVCPGLVSLEEAGDLADRLIATVAEPVLIDGERIAVGASVGISLGRGHEVPDAVLNRADLALYEAKRAGRGGWRAADDRG